MHPEFKAYVEAVCDTVDGVQPARVTHQSNLGVRPGTTTPRSFFFKVIADFLEELPPYYCELKMVPGVKRITKQTWQHHDAIGYHGLV